MQVWILKGKTDDMYRDMWVRSMDDAIAQLGSWHVPSSLTYFAEFDRCAEGPSLHNPQVFSYEGMEGICAHMLWVCLWCCLGVHIRVTTYHGVGMYLCGVIGWGLYSWGAARSCIAIDKIESHR
jgi:hypothetical protein